MKFALLKSALLFLGAIMVVALAGCSPKKNTAATRNYQAFITRYNIYYNGDKHFKETLHDMETKYEDDYSQLVYVHPAEARANEKAPQPSGDFNRSIEKAQKAIQLRSIKKRPAPKSGKGNDPAYKEWMKRDEYNPFLHNAWMMMGRSQFLNGDFLGAASTFFYITKHFTWLPQTVTEAQIWQARSYCSIDWLFEAETLLRRIKPEQLDSKEVKHLYNLTYADFYIKSHDNERAIPYVIEAIKTAKGSQKTRLQFLLGQLYSLTGKKKEAYEAFSSAAKSPSVPYRTKFNTRIKQSEVYEGDNIEPEVKALKRMTRYDRNKTYLDQIYYAIGNLYLSRRDTTQAIENYELAVEKSTRSGIDKALAQITLGGLYYDLGKYEKAQPCYSEGLPLIPDNYPNYKELKRRSDYLDELAVYSQNVTLQDSLLKLSYMTPDEQKAVAEKLIKELKKKEAEEAEAARREEYMANRPAGSTDQGSNAPTQFVMNSDNSWYFYNPATVTAGKTDFQRRWGSRKLEDDWRRRNKASYAFTNEPEENTEGEGDEDSENPEEGDDGQSAVSEEEAAKANDPHYVEYYIKQIPKDDQERAVCNDVIQEGLYNMGVILKDKLEDFPASEREFNELDSRFPDNVYRLDAYYNLYLMYVRSGQTAKAEMMRQKIIRDFPDSSYGHAMTDPDYISNLRLMETRQQQLYDEAYEAYMDNKNRRVHKIMAEMEEKFPLSKLMPKFLFLDALSYVTENNPEKFKEVLADLLERYPDTDLTPYAAAYMKGLNAGRELHKGAGNMRGMLWDIRLGGDDEEGAGSGGPIEFDLNPDEPQLLIMLFPTDSVAPNMVLYEVARHNFSQFAVKDFDLEAMNFGRLGLLIIKPFENVNDVNAYRSIMAANDKLQLPSAVRPVTISVANFKKLLDSHGSFEEYFNFIADQTYRNAEEAVLPPEYFGPSEGIPDSEEEREDVDEQELEEEDSQEPEEEGIDAPDPESFENLENLENLEAPESPGPDNLEIKDQPSPEQPQAEVPQAEVPKQREQPKVAEPQQPAEPQPEAPKPAEKPKAEPQQPAQQPKPQQPQPKPKPVLPSYPSGSEGDDPLFD